MLQDDAQTANTAGQPAGVYNDGPEDGPNQRYGYAEHDHCPAWDPADDYQHYSHDAEGAVDLQHNGYPAHLNSGPDGGNDHGAMYAGHDVPPDDADCDYPAHDVGCEPMHDDATGGTEPTSQEWEADQAGINANAAPGTGPIPSAFDFVIVQCFSTRFAITLLLLQISMCLCVFPDISYHASGSFQVLAMPVKA